MKSIRNLFYLLMALLAVGCEPETDYLEPLDYNKLGYLIGENFNLSVFNRAIRRAGLDQTLLEEGPFTLFTPSNDAFLAANYDTTSIMIAPQATISRLVNYHLLDGVYELDKLPFLFNQELRSRGGKLYVTRWVKDQDTILTVNGRNVLPPINYATNNGLMQVIDAVLEPVVHNNLADAIGDMEAITLFAQAVQRSGMEDLLKEAGSSYTVFAPSNQAMRDYGFASVEDVYAANPAELAALVRYHIVQDRRFINDYFLLVPTPNENATVEYRTETGTKATRAGLMSNQFGRMLDGNMITFSIETAVVGIITYTQFKLKDVGGRRVYVLRGDVLSENGVLHVVDGVLRHRL